MEAPSVEIVSQLLRKCEQGIHKEGWDQAAVIAGLVWQPGSKLNMLDTDIRILGRTPHETITQLGKGFLNDPVCGRAVQSELGKSFFGFAHYWEAWQEDSLDLEQTENWMHLHDRPENAVEVRMICVVDLLGRPYTIRRVRGRKTIIYNATSEIKPFGSVHDGLAKMVLASVREMPWAADYQLDLELFQLPRLRDLIDDHSLGRVTQQAHTSTLRV
jgi:hypothetical protein